MEGGADACSYMGPKIIKRFAAELRFGRRTGYWFALEPTPDNRMIFADETAVFGAVRDRLRSGHAEAKLKDLLSKTGKWGGTSWVVNQVRDTSLTAGVRR